MLPLTLLILHGDITLFSMTYIATWLNLLLTVSDIIYTQVIDALG